MSAPKQPPVKNPPDKPGERPPVEDPQPDEQPERQPPTDPPPQDSPIIELTRRGGLGLERLASSNCRPVSALRASALDRSPKFRHFEHSFRIALARMIDRAWRPSVLTQRPASPLSLGQNAALFVTFQRMRRLATII